MTGEKRCLRLPAGWACMHDPHHEGPCAAVQVVDTRPKHVHCDSYTDLQPVFHLYREQQELIKRWLDEHHAKKHGGPSPYRGAIGGGCSYKFTPTSIGTVISVHCVCGEALDVSDYHQW